MKIIVTGCPQIESDIGAILQTYGLDIPLYKWGKYGCLSWSLAIPFDFVNQEENYPLRKESTQEDYYVCYVSDPLYTIPLFVGMDSYIENIMINVIKSVFNMDLSTVSNPDKYALMFLFWNKMIQMQNPDIIFKLEDPQLFKNFIEEKIGIIKNNVPLFIPPLSSDLTFWNGINANILHGLDKFCEMHGYLSLSSRIRNFLPKSLGNNPFNRMVKSSPLIMQNDIHSPRQGPIQGSNIGGVTILPKLVHNVHKFSNDNIDASKIKKNITSFGISRKK